MIIYLLLERVKEEREGVKHQCVRETSIGCLLYAPQLGTWPTTWACALTWTKTSNLSLCGVVLDPLSHTGQGLFSLS